MPYQRFQNAVKRDCLFPPANSIDCRMTSLADWFDFFEKSIRPCVFVWKMIKMTGNAGYWFIYCVWFVFVVFSSSIKSKRLTNAGGGGMPWNSGGKLLVIFISTSLPVMTTVSVFAIEYSLAASRLPSPFPVISVTLFGWATFTFKYLALLLSCLKIRTLVQKHLTYKHRIVSLVKTYTRADCSFRFGSYMVYPRRHSSSSGWMVRELYA